MALIDKETGKTLQPSDLMPGLADSEEVCRILGILLDVLHSRGLVSDHHIHDIIPDAWRWSDIVPAEPPVTEE